MTSGHYATLKKKHRDLRSGFPESVSLRVHRSLSWLQRAEQEISDPDVKFVLLWIGFNAAYAGDVGGQVDSERGSFTTFFDALVSLDNQRRLYDLVWARFPHEIRLLLDNKYVFSPFWAHQNGASGYENWPDRLEASKRAVNTALRANDTVRILSILFDRLYILRNQLVHGGATWGGGVNRDQVRDGAALLHGMLPIFVDLIMDYPHRDWGRPYYPVVE